MSTVVRPNTTVSAVPRIKVSAAYGKLYITGPEANIARKVEGAAMNTRMHGFEISLTLESLRELRKLTGASKVDFAKCCTPDVLAWTKAAALSERQVTDVHAKLTTGWRQQFPWYDSHNQYKPFAHQEIMASVASVLDGTAYVCDMGTGKTRASVEVMRYKLETGAIDIGVVICPRGVMGTWEREFARWSEGIATVRLDMQVKERRKIIESYVHAVPTGHLVMILNYDVLYLLVDDLIALSKRKRLGSICDEMHKCANPNAKVTKAAMKLTQYTEWRLGLTGTPIRKNIDDIWSQWYLIDLGVTFGANFVQYKREFMVQHEWNQFELTAKIGAMEEVGMRMRRRGLRFTKAECLDLPPKVYEKIEVELSAEQRKAYRQMEQYLVARLTGQTIDGDTEEERVATAANQLVMILRLTQITSGFVKDEDGRVYTFPSNPKLDALEEITRENIKNQNQIAWAIYRQDIDAIVDRLADLKPRIIDGRQVGKKGQEERDAIEVGFANNEFPLIVANPAAGGVGLNLQAASMAHYFSQSYSLIQRLQSEDRCHRSGSERHNKVTYNDYIAKNTVDEVVSAAIADKKDISDVVIDLRRHIGLDN